jgi:hypothetical protein
VPGHLFPEPGSVSYKLLFLFSADGTPIPTKRFKQKRKKKSTLPKEFHGSGSEVEEVEEEEDEAPTLSEIRRQYNKAHNRHKDDGDEKSYEKRLE